jgi:hypothetical protein
MNRIVSNNDREYYIDKILLMEVTKKDDIGNLLKDN